VFGGPRKIFLTKHKLAKHKCEPAMCRFIALLTRFASVWVMLYNKRAFRFYPIALRLP